MTLRAGPRSRTPQRTATRRDNAGYDQMEGDRLRHTARFLRWRPDREAVSCTYDQLERPVRDDLARILG